MENLIIKNSTDSSVIPKVLQKFGRTFIKYDILANGSSNINWKIKTTTGDYVLKRIKHDRVKDFIDYHNWLSTKLIASNYPYIANVYTMEGNVALTYDGDIWQLRPYLQGRFHQLGRKTDNNKCISALVALHKLHNGGKKQINLFNYWLTEPDTKLKYIFNISKHFLGKQTSKEMMQDYERIISLLEGSKYKNFLYPSTIIHGDFHSGNLLFDKFKLKCVIDWDNSMIAPRIVDLSKCIYLLSRKKHGEFNINNNLAIHLLRYYDRHMQLSDEELSIIPLLLSVNYIPDPKYIDTYNHNVEKLKWFLYWTYSASINAQPQLDDLIFEYLNKRKNAQY